MSIEELKKALGGFFYKDLSRYEPDKIGVTIGENIRIHQEGDEWVVRFLKDTAYGPRKQLFDRLAQAKVPHRQGDDFYL